MESSVALAVTARHPALCVGGWPTEPRRTWMVAQVAVQARFDWWSAHPNRRSRSCTAQWLWAEDLATALAIGQLPSRGFAPCAEATVDL